MKQSIREKDETDDVPSEVNFKGGERGKYAHRFGEVTQDEEAVANFLVDRGFKVVRVGQDRFAKTPDFQLFKEDSFVAYCEVKTFERDVWLDKMLREAESAALVGGGRHDPIYNRILNAVHTGAKQLLCANLKHEVLNVLVIVNHDQMAQYKDLVSVLSGKWDPLADIDDKTHEQFSEGRIREEKYKIDLYIWLDVDQHACLKAGAPFVPFLGNYENRSKVCSLFGIDPGKVKTVG